MQELIKRWQLSRNTRRRNTKTMDGAALKRSMSLHLNRAMWNEHALVSSIGWLDTRRGEQGESTHILYGYGTRPRRIRSMLHHHLSTRRHDTYMLLQFRNSVRSYSRMYKFALAPLSLGLLCYCLEFHAIISHVCSLLKTVAMTKGTFVRTVSTSIKNSCIQT